MTRRHHGFSIGHLFPIALTAIAFAITGCSTNSLPIGEVPDSASTDTAARGGTGGAGTGGMAGAGSGGMVSAGTGGVAGAGTGGMGAGGSTITDASTITETQPSIDAADAGGASDASTYDGRPLAGCEACLKWLQCCQAIDPHLPATQCRDIDFCIAIPVTQRGNSQSTCVMFLKDTVNSRTIAQGPAPAACM